ncbi:hypothetical protein ACLB2K_006475 [Fragaria x ananassa]
MSEPIILSDEDDDHHNATSYPFPPFPSKKRRTQFDPNPNPTVLILDNDPTPLKPGPKSTAFFVPDTPNSDVAIVKCTRAAQPKLSGIDGVICLESDNEPGSSCGGEKKKENGSMPGGFGLAKVLDWSPSFVESSCGVGHSEWEHTIEGSSSNPTSWRGDIDQVLDCPDNENIMDQMGNILRPGKEYAAITEKENITKEEEKLQREALKAEAAEMKKLQKEKLRWEKGKFALKSIVAEIDSKVIESGSVGGSLLSRFAERGLTYRITSNPIERSIVWTMTVPEHISQLSPEGVEIQYILIVYEAEDFCKLIINESLPRHVSRVQNHYPSYTVCYLTNKLIAYVRKREGEMYNGRGREGHPTVDKVQKVLADLTTSFSKVHSRQCKDEAELAEHVVGLTCSLSSCLFRKKLTRLDVNANGSFIAKDCVDRNLIKQSSWLKALVAIPKVQPRFAIAIGKKYPTMKSLLSVYMDPNISIMLSSRGVRSRINVKYFSCRIGNFSFSFFFHKWLLLN